MASTATDNQDSTGQNPEGALLPLLSVVLLVGIGLVSVIDALTAGSLAEGLEAIPDAVGDSPVVLIAPGQEEELSTLSTGRLALLAPPWGPLPTIDREYWVVVADGVDLPLLPEGREVGVEIAQESWTWYHIAADADTPRRERWDIVESIRAAEVAFESEDGTRHPCDSWRFGRWTCGLEDWLWVGPTEAPFRGRGRECIWAHPRENSDLVIRVPGVPVGERLRGRYGIADTGADMEDGAPVDFRVRVGETHRDFTAQNRQGMTSFRVPVDADESGATVDVEFRVSSTGVGRRHFCFTAAMQGAAPSRAERDDEDESDNGSVPDGDGGDEPGTGAEAGEGTGAEVEVEGPADGTGIGTRDGVRLTLPARRITTPALRGRNDLLRRPALPTRDGDEDNP